LGYYEQEKNIFPLPGSKPQFLGHLTHSLSYPVVMQLVTFLIAIVQNNFNLTYIYILLFQLVTKKNGVHWLHAFVTKSNGTVGQKQVTLIVTAGLLTLISGLAQSLWSPRVILTFFSLDVMSPKYILLSKLVSH
jgi:hypothetical protein